MKLSLFEPQESPFPKLKVKGAECKHLGPPLLQVMRQHLSPLIPMEKHMLDLVGYSVRIEELLDAHKEQVLLPMATAEEVKNLTTALNMTLTVLGHHFHGEGTRLFGFTIKNHYLMHIGIMAKYMSPRMGSCYAGEDFVRITKKIIRASPRGCPPHKLVDPVMRKYLQGMHFTFTDRAAV